MRHEAHRDGRRATRGGIERRLRAGASAARRSAPPGLRDRTMRRIAAGAAPSAPGTPVAVLARAAAVALAAAVAAIALFDGPPAATPAAATPAPRVVAIADPAGPGPAAPAARPRPLDWLGRPLLDEAAAINRDARVLLATLESSLPSMPTLGGPPG